MPDDQLSLAIGREGQNARLAARLTGWRIDIRSETEFAKEEQEAGYEEEETGGRCARDPRATAGAARTPRCRARATAAWTPTRRSPARTPTSSAEASRSRPQRTLRRLRRRTRSALGARSASLT